MRAGRHECTPLEGSLKVMVRILRLVMVMVGLGALPGALASNLPDFPKRGYLVSKEDVKRHWISRLTPRFGTPSRLRKNYHELRARYRTLTRERNRQIARIKAGLYDDRAQLVALQNNLGLHEFRRRHLSAEILRKEIARLEFELAQQEAARGAQPDPAPVPVAAAPVPRVIVIEEENDDGDCPPADDSYDDHHHHKPHHGQRPQHTRPRLDTEWMRPNPPGGFPTQDSPRIPAAPDPPRPRT